jgi:hypothetical protein
MSRIHAIWKKALYECPAQKPMTSGMSTESIADVIFMMRSKGVKVWADNGRLHYQAPKGALTPKDLEILRAVREEILTIIENTNSSQGDPQLIPRLPSDRVPLAFSQQHLWHFLNLERNTSMRSVAAAVRIRGRLDISSLQKSFALLVRRHESLRTRIVVADGVPGQHIDEDGPFFLEILDLTSLPQDAQESEARRLAEQFVHQPILVSVDPLFGARLLKLDEFDHVLIIATDHIISDAASVGIIWRDVFTLYAQSLCGQQCTLPKMPVQFPDYAVWQRKTHPLWAQKHSAYWNRRLAGGRRVHLFTRDEIAQRSRMKWATLPIRFGGTLTDGLLETARQAGTSLVMSVLTAFVSLVLRWSNTMDLVLPFVTAGRLYPEVENTVGFFGTLLLLRIEIFEEDTFLDLLQRVTKEYAVAYEHDDSLRMAVQMHWPEFILNPIFNWIPRKFNVNPGGPGCAFKATDSLLIAQYDIAITPRDDEEWDGEPRIDLSDSNDGVTGAIGYRADRFTRDTVERFGRSLLSFAEKLAKEPRTRVIAVTCQQ